MHFAVLNGTLDRSMCPTEYFFCSKSDKAIQGMIMQTPEDAISKKFFCFPAYS